MYPYRPFKGVGVEAGRRSLGGDDRREVNGPGADRADRDEPRHRQSGHQAKVTIDGLLPPHPLVLPHWQAASQLLAPAFRSGEPTAAGVRPQVTPPRRGCGDVRSRPARDPTPTGARTHRATGGSVFRSRRQHQPGPPRPTTPQRNKALHSRRHAAVPALPVSRTLPLLAPRPSRARVVDVGGGTAEEITLGVSDVRVPEGFYFRV